LHTDVFRKAKHTTQITPSTADGVIAVYKATLCMPAFCIAFDVASTTHEHATLQKQTRKHHVCDCSNGAFGNHGDPRQIIHDVKQMAHSRSMDDCCLSLL
jgi:hypothetical protein